MLKPFDYHRPKTLDEACRLLAEDEKNQVYVGGTDLLVKIRDGKHAVSALVDLKGIDELQRRIWLDGDHLVIGALATITDVVDCDEVRRRSGLACLLEPGRLFGCLEIRHRATVCGNIAHASPGSEYGSPMFVLEAIAVVHGPEGERSLPVADFYKGPTWNALEPGEILKALRIPLPPETARSAYLRRSRVRGMDLAGLNLALLITDPDDPAARKVRIAMGAVHKVPLRATEVEAFLSGAPITKERIEKAKRMLSESINPRPTSMRATPAYKKAMVGHLAEAGLERLLPGFPEEVK